MAKLTLQHITKLMVVCRMRRLGYPVWQIAEAAKVSTATIYRWLKQC